MRRRWRFLPLVLCIAGTTAPAGDWTEPAPGTALREDLLDALRPHAEWALGAPVEFVVWDLRVAGDIAFASLWAQRPGGGEIDIAATPMVRRGDYDPLVGDGPTMQALYVRSGRVWVAVQQAIGPTDVWWAWEEYCPVWRAVIPEVCD